MAHFEHFWNWLRDWSVYILPALSNLILVLLGIIMSLPKLAEAIEGTPKHRKWFAAVCLLFGLVGFAFEVSQRRSGDQQTRQLVANVDTLVGSTNTLVISTNQTVTTLGLLMPQIYTLNTRVASLNVKIAAAKGDPQLIATLQTQVTETQQKADALNQQLLLLRLSAIIEQLQSTLEKWRSDDTVARHKTPKGKYDPDYLSQSQAWRQQYGSSLQPTMAEAKYIREQLRVGLPANIDIGKIGDDSRLGKAAYGQPIDITELNAIIGDLTVVRRKIYNLSIPPEQ